MKVTVEFEDNNNVYTVDFLALIKRLKITEQQVRAAVLAEVING